jgi:hypothetical protein
MTRKYAHLIMTLCFKSSTATRGRGNDGLWKAWENDKTFFPPFPQTLEIATAISTLHTASTTEKNKVQTLQTKAGTMMHNNHYPGGPN